MRYELQVNGPRTEGWETIATFTQSTEQQAIDVCKSYNASYYHKDCVFRLVKLAEEIIYPVPEKP